MSPPNGVKPVGSGGVSPSVDPKEERKQYLKNSEFFLDPTNASDPAHLQKKWEEDRDFRVNNYKLYAVLDLFTRFMNRDSEVSPQKLKAAVDEWAASSEFKADPVNTVVLKNMHRILGQFQAEGNVDQAKKLKENLPAAPADPVAEKPKEGKGDKGAEGGKPVEIDPKKTLAVGLEFQNDSVPLAIFDAAGIPLSALAAEKSYFTLKPTVDFPMGKWVGMVRLNGGMFEARGIPGDDFKPGDGYRIGLDFGLVNPYSASHERSGLGLELTGVANHAGQKSGIEAPGPLVRLHLFRESDINIPIAGRFELGFSSFFNHQETFITLGNNQNLLATPGGNESNPLATTSAMFARSPLRWFGVSGRYYINGMPERETREDLSKPFRPGEGVAKIGNLWTGQMINFNRREDIPAFANTQVFFGTFWPLGIPASQQQFDTVSTGLLLYSLQDGFFMARNAQLRGEIWRRDDSWILRGLMLGGDALLLGANIYRAATAKADPPVNQTIEEFVKDPGSVTDFSGRAGKLNLKLFPAEFALSAIDASGIAGDISDPDLTRFFATSGVATGLGLLGFLFSAPLSGGSCGDSGTLFRCSFHGRKSEYFKSGIDAGPQNMTDIENEYVMSASSGALLSWGVTRLLQPLFVPKADAGSKTAGGKKDKSTALVEDIHFNVGINPGGGSVLVGGRF
ncbi:hypothetical protein FBR05_09455 [Deltaproteobacteria bacterium PRO3]|nr:hypothetical protein [Deltaproteobacteria bacterium PRO3]